jgi:hypothetical protein
MVNVSDDARVSNNGWVFHQFNNFVCLPITRHNYSLLFLIIFAILKLAFLLIDSILVSLESDKLHGN